MTGYSGRPLVEKLGIKAGDRVSVIHAPAHYLVLLGKLPEGVTVKKQLRGQFDFIHIFVQQHQALVQRLPQLKATLQPAGMIWVSWPKKSSGVVTDLDENSIRAAALASGLVDVKVCAVDDIWSGLKLVRRLRDRPTKK